MATPPLLPFFFCLECSTLCWRQTERLKHSNGCSIQVPAFSGMGLCIICFYHTELRQSVNTEEILKAILFHSGEALDNP